MTEKEYEKRRYEIARDCLAALMVGPEEINVEICAELAVKAADALMEKLAGLS